MRGRGMSTRERGIFAAGAPPRQGYALRAGRVIGRRHVGGSLHQGATGAETTPPGGSGANMPFAGQQRVIAAEDATVLALDRSAPAGTGIEETRWAAVAHLGYQPRAGGLVDVACGLGPDAAGVVSRLETGRMMFGSGPRDSRSDSEDDEATAKGGQEGIEGSHCWGDGVEVG